MTLRWIYIVGTLFLTLLGAVGFCMSLWLGNTVSAVLFFAWMAVGALVFTVLATAPSN